MPEHLGFDLGEYWRIILKRRLWGVAAFLIVIGGVVAVTLKQRPVYEAHAVVRIASREPMATIHGTRISWYGIHGGLETEIELIQQSKALHRLAASDLRGMKDAPPGLARRLSGIRSRQVRGAISVGQVGRSDLVRVSAKGPTPAYAVAVADAVVEAYREGYIKARSHDAAEKVKMLKGSLDMTQERLAIVQEKAKTCEEANLKMGTAATYRNRIADINVRIIELRQQFTDRHPQIQKLLGEVKDLERILRKLPQQELEYRRFSAQVARLGNVLDQLSLQYRVAEINHGAKRESAAQKIDIVSGAAGTAKRLRPDVLVNFAVGVPLALICGVMVCFLVEILDTSIGKVEDIEAVTGLPVMALIPDLAPRQRGVFRGVLSGWFHRSSNGGEPGSDHLVCGMPMNSLAMESYRALRESVRDAMARNGAGKTLVVTSAAPGEGKTLTTINLALLSVQMGQKVLILEADMRNPSVHRFLSIPRGLGLSDMLLSGAPVEECARGIVDLLMGGSEWDSLLSLPNIDGLHVVTCGTKCPNPTEALGSPAMKAVIDRVTEEYDVVYIDTPPALPVSDVFALAKWVRSALVVYEVGGIPRKLLLRTLRLLEARDLHVLGIALNRIRADVHLPAYHRAGYGYYGYPPVDPSGREAADAKPAEKPVGS